MDAALSRSGIRLPLVRRLILKSKSGVLTDIAPLLRSNPQRQGKVLSPDCLCLRDSGFRRP
jgi:hypothetical protein